ncbi:MAG: APC family permease [Actinobacteria bacterium]|nr:MAG: APC family permease [Actinomycetota bacterium]
MEAGAVRSPRSFDRLRTHSIGLPQVLFQSITHMAPAAAVAYSIYISVPFSKQALALSVLLALIACFCAATAIGQLAKLEPSAGGLYAYAARSLGPWAGFNVAWLFILFEPLVAPFLYLEFGWAMREVMSNEAGWHYTGQWWIWALLMTVIVFLLTYRDIRISTTAGVILGAFEILVFGGLAVWMIISNIGDLNLAPFNPNHAAGHWNGVIRGMVFGILAFIGFEAAAPLGEEARNPRRTVPFAVVGSAVAIGLFYILCSYAWVFGAGFDNFVNQATGPRDLQLDRGQLECGRQRRNAGVLRTCTERPGAAPAGTHASQVQDAVYRDRLDERLRLCALAAPGLEVGPAGRVRLHRDARRDRRGDRLHHHLPRLRLALLDKAPRRVQLAPALRAADRRRGALLLPALLRVREVPADVPDQVRELDRARLDRGGPRAHRHPLGARTRAVA